MPSSVKHLIFLGFGLTLLSGCGAARINDVSTNPADPPKLQGAPEQYSAKERQIMLRTWPWLQTHVSELGADALFGRVKAVADQMPRWKLLEGDEGRGRLHYVAKTRWLRFRDDVVLRVREGESGGSLLDIRSRSRVGQGDLGTNAKRIRRFLLELSK